MDRESPAGGSPWARHPDHNPAENGGAAGMDISPTLFVAYNGERTHADPHKGFRIGTHARTAGFAAG